MRTARRTEQSGFTLVEVMIAFFLLTLLAMTFSPVLLTGNLAIKRGHSREQATQSAQQEMEAWRRAGFNGLPAIASGSASVTRSFTPTADLPNRTGQVVFTRVTSGLSATTTETGRRRVVVTVTWRGAGNDRGSVTLTTLIAAPPVVNP